MFNKILALLLATQAAFAQVNIQKPDIIETVDYKINFVKNPSAFKNATLGVVTSSASVTRDTTNKINNVASFSCDTSAQNGYCEFTLNTINSPADSGNCQFKGVFKGDATLYSAQILDGSSNLLTETGAMTNETNWRDFSVNYPCATSRKIRITQTVAGTSPAISVGLLYYGLQTNIGAGVPNNVFSAKVSSTGVVSDENEDFISGSCSRPATGVTKCDFVVNKFNTAPTCLANRYIPGQTTWTSANGASITGSSTTSSVYFISEDSAYNPDLVVSCTRAGTDFIQPAITPNQWNYGRTAYTPTFTGFGTPTNVECFHSRDGAELVLDCKFTSGTSTAVEARVSFPNSLVSADTTRIPSISRAGGALRSVAVAATYNVLKEPSVSYITFGELSSSSGGLTKINGNGFVNSGGIVSFNARIPIQGWTENQNAPQLIGSVTSNSSGALIEETCRINNNGSASFPNTWDCGHWLSSPTRSALGRVTATIKSGTFSADPNCTCSVIRGTAGVGSGGACNFHTTTSKTLLDYRTAENTDATYLDLDTFIRCTGPR